MRRLAVFLATTCGVGYSPVAPGTLGSLVGLVIYLYTLRWPALYQVVLAGGITVVGVWASSRAAEHFSREDPSQVVIDEVAGQLVTFLWTGVGTTGAVIGFALFRVLDVVKPWPAGRFERLHGGTGIMADDVMAGLYANLLLQVAVRTVPGGL